MTRKRRIFDVGLPDDQSTPTPVAAEPAEEPARRGPMAAAVRETAESLRDRQSVETRIRAENDALAHEHVRLKRAGLITDLIPTHKVDADKLTRDRAPGADADLSELKASILAIGLSNPIRVEKQPDGRYELIQGWRRLQAFIALEAEHQDGRFVHIPAGIVATGDALETSYRRMVDENLVRKDVSFAEMAMLARAYAADPATGCDDVDKAVAALFRSAGYQKRSYIRAFADLLGLVGDVLAFPQTLGRKIGLDLRKVLEGGAAVGRLRAMLAAAPERTAETEAALLRRFVDEELANRVAPVTEPAAPANLQPAARARTSLRVATTAGVMRCVATAGRLELRGPADFAAVDPRRLEAAVTALLEALGAGNEGN